MHVILFINILFYYYYGILISFKDKCKTNVHETTKWYPVKYQ